MKVKRKQSLICPRRPGERQLYPYQESVLSWAKDKARVGLFMEMRLGKTLTTIRWVRSNTSIKRVLVIAPLTVIRAWERELEEEGCSSTMLRGTKAKRERIALSGEPGWYLTNFETLRSSAIIAGLQRINPLNPRSHMRWSDVCEWDCVIIDESTRIKNPLAQVTKNILKGFQSTRYRAVLSGLPAPESPANYWAQMAFINGGEWMKFRNFHHWRNEYFVGGQGQYYPKAGMLQKIKDELKTQSIALSRKAVGIGNKTVRESLDIPMEIGQRRAFMQARDDFLKEIEDGREITTDWAIVRLGWMHRISGGFNAGPDSFPWTSKMDALMTQVTGDLSQEKIVIWAHFTAEVDAIHARCESAGIKATKIHGKLGFGEKERWKRIDSFTDSDTRVIVAQPETMKYGVTLGKASDTAIYYSRSFSLETNRQSEDRIALPGKKTPLLILDMVTKDSMDAVILGRLKRKNNTSKRLLDELIEAVISNNYNA